MTFLQGSLLFGSAMAAGMVNSAAGGGTLLTFPSLIWAGHSPIIANATSTVALVPGTWSSMWGYRRELENTPRRFFVLVITSLIGGILGAALLNRTPPAVFAALVPFLILFATILFLAQEPIQRLLRTSDATQHPVTRQWLIGTAFYQFLIAVYGGYFGAGIGILMLAALGLMGLSNIHQMNGLKNIFGSSINAVAALYFIIVGLVNWPAALLMAAGAIIGGYGAPGLARRLGQKFVRRTVVVIGLAMTISLFFKQH
jgi:uncharacterized membrane protein YfcA